MLDYEINKYYCRFSQLKIPKFSFIGGCAPPPPHTLPRSRPLGEGETSILTHPIPIIVLHVSTLSQAFIEAAFVLQELLYIDLVFIVLQIQSFLKVDSSELFH
jgi:hypothetical protein